MIEYPEIVYKYRSWKGFHKDILLKNEIYFASPNELNDPFDFRIPRNWSLLTDEQMVEFAESRINSFTNIPFGQIEDYKKFILNKLKNDKELQSESDTFTYEKQNLDFGVLSLSKTYKGVSMWSHYADSHKGFCVGFKTKELVGSGELGYGHVEYLNDFPQINPLESSATNTANIQIYSKSKEWEYEKEFRILKIKIDGFKNKANRIHAFKDQAIAEIILGMEIIEDDKKTIIEMAKSKNIKVYQIHQIPFTFEIEKKEIKY
ncbi:MAG TPA: DUF2971 domain-containing protein [Cytophagaceae bacterium]|jgi:hypothetical protein|nr:DUF2971 domain-containing protein [Cytophagaceae bacterium]